MKFPMPGLLIFALLVVSAIPCSAVVYVRSDSPGPTFDGNSWATAYHTVQAGIDDADTADEEVWVAGGTYVERITLKAGVGLYGGFAGTEVSRSERSRTANVTILDGNQAGSVVTVSSDADAATVIDGFTISNGKASGCGGGINCVLASPTITHNVIDGNTALETGGAIYCYRSAPRIAHNIISDNTSPNTDSAGGGGIMCDHSSNPTIVNNTLVGNKGNPYGGGVVCANGSSPSISNNIIAFCNSGISAASGCSPTLSHNCIYANPWGDYSGVSAGAGDISADPQFARAAVADYHIMPSSPCRNAGDSTASGMPTDDIDGQVRIEGTAVDIGADESYGEAHVANVIRVKADSPMNGPGDDWSNAWHSVTEAMGHGSAGCEVWVAAGTYNENITLKDGVALYGGFAGSEAARVERDWTANITALDGGGHGSVVTVEGGARPETTIDGFTIRGGTGGGGVESMGGGIYCNMASVTISNNRITANSSVGKGGGIYVQGSSMWILNNVIVGNTCRTYGGGGIYGQCYEVVILGNTISNNAVLNTPGATQYGGGIRLISSRQVISGNTITDNSVSGSGCTGGGLHMWGTSPGLISNNVISGNRAVGSSYGRGGGLGWWSGSPTISGNTIENNVASSTTPSQSGGGGIFADAIANDPQITGNIIRGNSTDYRGGGICSLQGGATITGNTITGNQGSLGAGIYSAGTITGNTITANRATNDGGGLVFLSWSTLCGNVIADNEAERGGGVFCTTFMGGTITLNTIVGNRGTTHGGGVMFDLGSPQFTNNIVAFNDSGIASTNSRPIANRNCVYGNTRYDYYRVAFSSDNISLDPLFADRLGGDYHLLPASPCIDTGDNAHAGCQDIDGQARTYGGYADIGADEFEGIPTIPAPTFSPDGGTYAVTLMVKIECPTPGAVIRYTTNGNEPTEADRIVTPVPIQISASTTLKARAWKPGCTTSETKTGVYTLRAPTAFRVKHDAPGPVHDGSSWDTAYLTVREGLAAASPGDEVWVARGTYTECVTLGCDVALYGGFAGAETDRLQRPAFPRAYPDPNETMLDGDFEDTVIVVQTGGGRTYTRIDGFTITNGSGEYGGGVQCWQASPVIANNQFRSNSASIGGGVFAYRASPVVSNNWFVGNTADTGAGVSALLYSPATIANNVFAGNSATTGGAVSSDLNSNPSIICNTMCGNQAATGGAVYCGDTDLPVPSITNNIIAFNSSGVFNKSTRIPTAAGNCVYGNDEYNYSGMTNPTGSNGNMSVDPKLADAAHGNFHIRADSPCRNAGTYNDALVGAVDMDGQARVPTVDIGADESDGTAWPVGPYAVIRVAPDGDDGSDGGSWTSAMRTVRAAIERASRLGGEVWVRKGCYDELIELKPYAYVYGGFTGTETGVAQRPAFLRPLSDPDESILDGQYLGTVVTAQSGYRVTRLDGFTVRNGQGVCGGIYCSNATTTLTNNNVTGNMAESFGGGIACLGSHSLITNNCVAGNTSGSLGGGIYIADSSRPVMTGNIVVCNSAVSLGGGICSKSQSQPIITSNTIADNTAGSDGGGIYSEASNLTLSNNIVAFNSPGIYRYADLSTALLQNNDVYGNAAYNYSGVTAGSGDIAVDPLFTNRLAWDYHLSHTSGCVDVGLNEVVGLPLVDIDGQPRIYNNTVDIGADEWHAVLADPSGAKRQVNGTIVEVPGLIVTAVFSSLFYAESPDRSCGISVYKSGHGITVGMVVNVKGSASTGANGEKYIVATTITPAGTGVVDPIAFANRDIGGGGFAYDPLTTGGQKGIKNAGGLNNIGLLVRTTGKVNARGTGWFYIDDGSGVRDNTGSTGMKVQATGLTIPPVGTFVQVTGISTCSKSGSDLYRLVRVRTQADIVPIY